MEYIKILILREYGIRYNPLLGDLLEIDKSFDKGFYLCIHKNSIGG